jgi:HEAT repeat protein
VPVDEERERFAAVQRAKERRDTDYLIGALVDPVHRVHAAVYLGQLEAVEATGPLLRLLDAADPTVRYHAAQSLGWIGAEKARSRLRETATEDEGDGVRAGAVWALGDIGDRSDLEFLIPFLDDPSLRVRGSAVSALGKLGDSRAVEPLRRARRRLRRSPLEWYWHRKVYNDAIGNLTRGPRDEPASHRVPWASGIVLLAIYFLLRYFAGFWWALVATLAAALVVAVFRFVGAITREETSPPPRRPRPPG